jgi:lipoyl(octanoyl) transferase
MNNSIIIHDLGLIEYEDALDYQLKLFNEIVDAKISNRRKNTNIITKNHLIFVEHNSVYTLGKSGEINNLLMNKEDLKNNNIKFYKTNRGGDITYHGPGQIVCYPILDLDNFFTDIHKYLRFLEEAVIRTCADFGVEAGRIQGQTGVWVDVEAGKGARKICAFGVKCSRWVTMHGLAFNVDSDLNFFDLIIPCGISDKGVTSLSKEVGRNISLEEVKPLLKTHLQNLFQWDEVNAS